MHFYHNDKMLAIETLVWLNCPCINLKMYDGSEATASCRYKFLLLLTTTEDSSIDHSVFGRPDVTGIANKRFLSMRNALCARLDVGRDSLCASKFNEYASQSSSTET